MSLESAWGGGYVHAFLTGLSAVMGSRLALLRLPRLRWRHLQLLWETCVCDSRDESKLAHLPPKPADILGARLAATLV